MAPAEYSAFARGELNPSGTLDQTGGWKIQERTPYQNQPLSAVRDHLHRQPTGFVEFHAMLVRTAIFDRIGFLDEGFFLHEGVSRFLHDGDSCRWADLP